MNIDSMKILEVTRDITVAIINNSPDKDLDAVCTILEKIHTKLVDLSGNRTEPT